MKGLILKDLYGMNVYRNTFGILLLMVAVLGFMGNSGFSFVPSMITMFVVMVSITLFSLDESSGWDRYAIGLPVSRRSIVAARYLFMVGLMLASLVLGFMLGMALNLAAGTGSWLSEQIAITITMACVGFIMCGVFCPVAYKFGANKSRFATIGVALIPTLFIVVVLPRLEPYLVVMEMDYTLVMLLALAACILLYFLSFLISVRVYTRKEF